MNARTIAIAAGVLCAACNLQPRAGTVLAPDAGCTGVAAASLDDVYANDFASVSPTGCNTLNCHASATAAGGLAFDTAAQLWAASVNVPSQLDPAMPLVTPGDPQHSYLYRKLLATADGRMPEGGPYLDAQALARVAGWICAGAPPPSDGGTSAGGFALSSVSPPSVLVGFGPVTLSLLGSGFSPTSTARLDRAALPTTFLDAGVLEASVDPAVTATAAAHSVDVVDGLQVTGSLPFTVENPAPALSSLSPPSVATNGAPFLLSLSGTGFTSASRVNFNGGYVATTYVSDALLRAQIPSLSVPKSYPVYVDNPAPGGGTSGTLSLAAANLSGPTVTGLDPDPAPSGMTFALQVSGSGYVCAGSPSVVHLGAAALSPATCSTTVLGVTAPALDAGTYAVQVENPSTAAFSNTMDLSVAPATGTPALASISPDAGLAGSPALTLTASGSGFAQGAVVQWAGSARPTTFQSATQLSAALSAADLADAGTYAVTVLNPPPGGGTSNALPFAVARPNPVPQVAALSPCGGVAGGPAFVLGITGTGFTADSTVTFRGTAVSVLSASGTSLQVSIPQALVSSPSADGTVAVVVTNPPPGGGSSAPAYYGLAQSASTLAGKVQGIFTRSCATSGCHSGTSPKVPADLSAGHAYASTVGVPCTECPPRLRVLACGPLPSQSYLMAKILSTDICSGSRMPKSAPLSSTDIQAIRDWIAQGAPP